MTAARAQLVVLAFGAFAAADAAAQAAPAPVTIELQTHDRWLLAGQQSRHVWFVSTTVPIRVESMRREGGITTWVMRARTENVQLQLDDARRILDVDADWPAQRPPPMSMPAIALRRFALNDRVRMYDFDAQEFALALRLPVARVGARWVDTVSIAATRDLTTQSLNGVRTSTIVGDTMVNGRRHWIVRDSMRAQYREAWGDWSRTLDTLEVRSRSVSGIIRGRTLVDATDTIMLAMRHDTTTWSGTDQLRYADGRTFSAPVTYTRHRSYRTYDAVAYAAHQAEQRRVAEATAFSIVIVPRNEFEERLARGERALLDSLTLVYRPSSDPDVRARIRQLRLPTELVKRFDSLHIAEGDTALLVARLDAELLQGRLDPGAERLELLQRMQRDPQIAFRYGIDQDPLYENLRDVLLRNPPALQPDTGQWPCAPQVCRLIAAQRNAQGDQRARDLALIAAFVLDPRQWADTIARSGSAMLEPARQLIAGVGATWAAAAKAPIPGPNADWRAWVHWMSGQDSSYRPALTVQRTRDVVRFDDTHRRALTLHQLITGRDVTGELRRAFASSPGDSARLVFGSMLLYLGAWQPTQDELVADLRSGVAARVALARRGVQLFMRDAPPATPEVAVFIHRRLLAHIIEKRNAFSALPGEPERPPTGAPRTDTIFMIADNVPLTLRADLPANVRLISPAQWDARSSRDAGSLMHLGDVRQRGSFIRTSYSTSTYYSRTPAQAPRASAQGEVWTLLRIGDELFLIDGSMWIT